MMLSIAQTNKNNRRTVLWMILSPCTHFQFLFHPSLDCNVLASYYRDTEICGNRQHTICSVIRKLLQIFILRQLVFCLSTVSLKTNLFTHLKVRQRKKEKQSKSKRENEFPAAVSLPKWLLQAPKPGSWNSVQVSQVGDWYPCIFIIILCLPNYISKKLDRKQGSWHLSQYNGVNVAGFCLAQLNSY